MNNAPSPFRTVIYLLCGLTYLLLAFDYRLHWDEPAYLYTAAYFDWDAILQGEFQPSGYPGFYVSRIFHVLLLKALFSLFPLGKSALYAAMLAYTFLLSIFAFITCQTIRHLLGPSREVSESILVFVFLPLYLYLSFKTLPEIPALLFSALSTWAFIKCLHHDSPGYLLLVSLSLTLTAFFKNALILQFLSFLTALFLLRPGRFKRRQIFIKSLYAGLLFLLLFVLLLHILNIPLRIYLGSLPSLMEEKEPFSSILLHILLVAGIFYICIPFAFTRQDIRTPAFFLLWFLLSTVPILFITTSIEARYFSGCMLAMAGLVALSYTHARSFLHRCWNRGRRGLAIAISAATILAILGATPIHLSIMAHEVRIDCMDEVLEQVDHQFGTQQYTILVPWEYVDFHYLRLVYPERNIRDVYTQGQNAKLETDPAWQAFQSIYYANALVRSIEELERLPAPWVYVGFTENPSVNNLRRTIKFFPFPFLHREMDKMEFLNHLELSWMWSHPRLQFKSIAAEGQYRVYRITMK